METRDRIEFVLLSAIWGSSFLFMRVAAPEFGPIALTGLRIAIAAVFLLALLAWRGNVRLLVDKALPLSALGILNSALPFSLFAYATLSITAGATAVLNGSTPLFAALIAYFWLKDRLSAARIAGLLIGLGGVVILVWDRTSFDGGSFWAPLAALGASLSYGIAANYTKVRLQNVPPLVSATGSMVAAALILLPLVVAYWPTVTPSLLSWLFVIVLGFVSTAFAYILYFRLISRVGPAKTVTVTYLIPLFGMLWGVIFLGEKITLGMLAATAVILLGTTLANGRWGKKLPMAIPAPAPVSPERA
jgi:drug/metabolite transporter (DMT)-like permease